MSLDVSGIYAQVVSHAKRLGVFQHVLTHEPKGAPPSGLTCCIWLKSLETVGEVSGLASTSVRLELSLRLYENFKAQPEDEIDKRLLDATSKLMDAYNGDFQLGDEAMEIDIFGAYGDKLASQGGYIELGGSMYRVVEITLPIIIPDVYQQVP